MFKIVSMILCAITCPLFAEPNAKQISHFLREYPSSYQDVLLQNKVIVEGRQLCKPRYELLQPILNSYSRPFSVLDIGAAEGYFSLKIAEEYNAVAVMIEGGYYKDKPNKLFEICSLNSHLKNLIFLHHSLTLQSMKQLSSREHFDVVLAFLVIHQIVEAMDKTKLYIQNVRDLIDELLKLGDNVIIEVSTEIHPKMVPVVEQLCQEKGGKYLGMLQRTKVSKPGVDGKFFLFTNTPSTSSPTPGIHLDTFFSFGGTYPKEKCIKLLQRKFSGTSPEKLILQGRKILVKEEQK